MNELQAVVSAARLAEAEQRPAILATVVRVTGSAYRRPGARMLLTEDGWQAGTISGGCLEGDVERKAWWRTRSGKPVIVTYDSTRSGEANEAESWGFGLGCNGVIDVLLERIEPDAAANPIDFIESCLVRGCSGVMATAIGVSATSSEIALGQRVFYAAEERLAFADTIPDSGLRAHIRQDAAKTLGSGSTQLKRYVLEPSGIVDVLLEVIHPPTPLVIFGAGRDAAILADLAHRLGWCVAVVDPRPGMTPRPDRFPTANQTVACRASDIGNHLRIDSRTLAVVMTHNLELDSCSIDALLGSPAKYIGVLGPRLRTDQILACLQRASARPLPGLDRVHGPVGLDIGADTPETIALSILAEMQAFSASRSGGSLRLRMDPIHVPAADANVFGVMRDGAESFRCDLTTTNATASV